MTCEECCRDYRPLVPVSRMEGRYPVLRFECRECAADAVTLHDAAGCLAWNGTGLPWAEVCRLGQEWRRMVFLPALAGRRMAA